MQQLSRFQLCHECYSAETAAAAAAAAAGVAPLRALPAGMNLIDLVPEHVEAIPPTSDEGNAATESEFFDTRQVRLLSGFSAASPRLPPGSFLAWAPSQRLSPAAGKVDCGSRQGLGLRA